MNTRIFMDYYHEIDFHLYSREQWKAMTMWVLHCAFTYFVSAWSKHGYAHAVTAKISLEEIKTNF